MTSKRRKQSTRRPPSRSRSDALPRRDQLLQSAVAVVGSSGLRGLTHRAVDREAGLPEGTCSVSFRTRLALLSALTEYVGTALAEQVQTMGAALPDLGDAEDKQPVIDATLELLHQWLRTPEVLICMSELSIEAVRTPSLRPAFSKWREHLIEIVESIVTRTQQSQTRLRAQAIVASIEGVLMSALLQDPGGREGYLNQTLAIVISGLADVDQPD